MCTFAYYAHSHGSGHCRYADYVSSLIPGGITILTTPDYPFRHAQKVVRLATEDVADAVRPRHLIDVPDYLHYAPVGRASILDRSLEILRTVTGDGIELVVVDVSVEVAALLRASSVPYIYVKMPGHRNDLPHLSAYQGAMGLVAYYPEALEGPDTPDWVKAKTAYLGFKPPLAAVRPPAPVALATDKPTICLVKGFGGGEAVDRAAVLIRGCYPDHYLIGLGQFSVDVAKYLDYQPGIVPDITPYLAAAETVVGACGSNLTAEIVHLGKAFVCLPCSRPFDEQEATALALKRTGLAIGLDDFLAGTQPPGATVEVRDRVSENSFTKYFRQLHAASDWREVLKPHLVKESALYHDTAL